MQWNGEAWDCNGIAERRFAAARPSEGCGAVVRQGVAAAKKNTGKQEERVEAISWWEHFGAGVALGILTRDLFINLIARGIRRVTRGPAGGSK